MTVPVPPLLVSEVMELEVTLRIVAAPDDPMESPVIAELLVIFEIILLEIVDVAPK